jgi:hypothetical protein
MALEDVVEHLLVWGAGGLASSLLLGGMALTRLFPVRSYCHFNSVALPGAANPAIAQGLLCTRWPAGGQRCV